MIKRETVYKIGVIGKPHGVRGEVCIRFADDVFDRVEADYLLLDMEAYSCAFLHGGVSFPHRRDGIGEVLRHRY